MGEQPQETPQPTRIFISYAPVRADEELRQRLESHLRLMERQGLIALWSSGRVGPGEKWSANTSAKLDAAQVILLLVSADYVASDPHWREMERAIARHEVGEARVIPVLLSPCDWRAAPLGRLEPLPRDGRPITLWDNPDEAWADVVRDVRQVLFDATAAPLSARPAKEPGRREQGVAIAAAIGVSVALVVPLGAILTEFNAPSAELMISAQPAPGGVASVDSSATLVVDSAANSSTSSSARAPSVSARAHAVPRAPRTDPVGQAFSHRGIVFSDRPVPNLKVLLVGTRCTVTTDDTGLFDFARCDPAEVSRLVNPSVYIRFPRSNRTCIVRLLQPPLVSRIDVTKEGCVQEGVFSAPLRDF